jgi:hypothetical protein
MEPMAKRAALSDHFKRSLGSTFPAEETDENG